MAKQFSCPTFDDFCTAQELEANLSLVAQSIIIWAGEQTEPGEWVGGIGQQNQRAAKNLRLHIGIIERGRAGRCGPEIFPTVWKAYQDFLARIASIPPARQTVFTAQVIPIETLQRVLEPKEPAKLLRRPRLRKVS